MKIAHEDIEEEEERHLTVDRLAAGAFLLPKAANGVVVPRVQVGVVVVIVGLVPANIRK